METTIKQGYVKKGKVLGKSMKKRYLVLRSASEKSRTGQLEFYDDQKQLKKKPTTVISVTSITGVKKIEAPIATGACLKEGGYFIRLDVTSGKDGFEELYLGLDTREQFDDWLTDLEFIVRLPDLIIPLSILPKREVPLTKQTIICKKIFGNIEFEDACPVEVLKTELGLKWQFNNRYFILLLTRSTLVFLDPETGLQALTYPIQNLRRCGHWQKLVFLESGRRTDTGPGYLWMFVHSKVLAKSFYSTLSNVMGSTHPLLVAQRYLCWDKFREELPPASVDLLTDADSKYQGPIADNENYFTPDVFDSNPVRNEFIHPVVRFNTPPLPPNHPIPKKVSHSQPHLYPQPSTSSPTTEKFPTLSKRKDDTELPPLPDETKRRASLPSKDKRTTENSDAGPSSKPDSISKSKSQVISGDRIKKRYDILVIDDTPELKVGENGQVVTKITHAITDGKGNVVKEQATPPTHSYYDVNEMMSKLTTINKKNSPSLGKKIAKLNTISTKKLSNTSAKEKIGNSTFYKGSLSTNDPNIAPYAEFSDLESQIPADVRRERLRIFAIKDTRSMENPTDTGTPLPPHTAVMPQTPVLYSTPQNFPVQSVYQLVDPKPRPILTHNSSKSLPDSFSSEEDPVYNLPSNSDYQRPTNNAEVRQSAPIAVDHDHDIVITEYGGDYDRLAAAPRECDLNLLGDPQTNFAACRTPSPCYEEMVSAKKGPSESKDTATLGEFSDDKFLFQPGDNNRSKHPLDTLVESQVFESSPLQAPPPTSLSEGHQDQDGPNGLYEVMMHRKESAPPPPNFRYFNIGSPIQQNDAVASSHRGLGMVGRRESSPQVVQHPKPILNKSAKSFSFRNSSMNENDLTYAELDLKNNTDATIIVNSIHSNIPPTYYDKIDHKVSKILNETVDKHRKSK